MHFIASLLNIAEHFRNICLVVRKEREREREREREENNKRRIEREKNRKGIE